MRCRRHHVEQQPRPTCVVPSETSSPSVTVMLRLAEMNVQKIHGHVGWMTYPTSTMRRPVSSTNIGRIPSGVIIQNSVQTVIPSDLGASGQKYGTERR